MAPTADVDERSKRVLREISNLHSEDLARDGIELIPNEENLFDFMLKLKGPLGTPYEGGVYTLSIYIPYDYPFVAPFVRFLTPIFHMNVSDTGNICVDILDDGWSPAITLATLARSLCSLFNDPNPDSPLELDIAKVYRRSREEHDSRARAHTLKYAVPDFAGESKEDPINIDS